MITWTSIEDKQPLNGEWVLATYYMDGKWKCWRTRIFHWVASNESSKKKITHWCYITPPCAK